MYLDANEEDEINAAFDKVDAQRATIRRLKDALRNLASVPAVVQTLGDKHTKNCKCPLCVARQLSQ